MDARLVLTAEQLEWMAEVLDAMKARKGKRLAELAISRKMDGVAAALDAVRRGKAKAS